MKKLLIGLALGAAAAGTGVYLYQRSHNAPASGPTNTAGSTLSMASQGKKDVGAALRNVAMTGAVLVVKSGESIQAAVVKAKPGDTIKVMPGVYKETVYIDKDNIAIVGVIVDGEWPLMDGERKLNDAILYSGSGIRIENMKITHYKGNGIMGQAGNNFVIRYNWIVDTGVYGIFPEFGKNGLIEYNVVSGIEDAAIYVGMCDNIQVSNNEVFASVAGIEIENSRHAIVENNMVYDNAGGILTFITPGLPIKTTFDVIIRNNFIISNNHKNFGAPGSIVSGVPSGTGIIVMAADDVQIENNIIRDNKNAGIIIADHQSFANINLDPEADPSPDRVSIYRNFFANNGYEPISDIKALMTLNLTSKGPDVLAIGTGKESCINEKASVKTLNIGSWGACKKTSSMDVASYLLAEPVPARINGKEETAEIGKRLYSGVCAGCHAYNVRMIGPPT
ncbi:MAG: right-handed parallel beta-helix repeat-containing protein, partial [Arenimonas sp.]|nr:right-handed parallel beta-helix repeat-containing protein [Arenimonas sp.]